LGVTADLALLGKLGMDIGLYDDVRGPDDKHTRNGKDIGPEESECFYQLLAAVNGTDQEDLLAHVTHSFEIAPLLQNPRAQHGKLMTIKGRARRITRIEVENPEFRKRFGLDHYYEVYVYISLGDAEVRLSGEKNDKHAPVVTNAFPIACCIRRLPERWAHLAKGSNDLHEGVRITAFNFKLWAYQTQMLQRFAAEEAERAAKKGEDSSVSKRRPLQPSPLFVGPDIEFVPDDVTVFEAASHANLIAVMVIFVFVGGTILAVRLYNRNDRISRAAMRQKGLETLPGDAANASTDKPDFSGLG
jgi:hypothetical protein